MLRPLKHIIDALEEAGFAPEVTGAQDRTIGDIRYDSRQVGSGELFVALRGASSDGHAYVSKVAEQGASAVLVARDWDGAVPEDLTVVRVDNTRAALAMSAAAFFGHPSRSMRVVGLTGTNGKTTVTFLLESIAKAAGLSCGVIGTVNQRFGDVVRTGPNTTPESLQLQRLLAEMRDAGVEVVFMEISSHALAGHRVDALAVSVGAFLNLSQDHLDFHGSMESYFEAKSRLFSKVLPASAGWLGRDVIAPINVGDAAGHGMAQSAGRGVIVKAFDPGAVDRTLGPEGSALTLPDGLLIETHLLGGFNVENTLTAVACARALNISDSDIQAGLAAITGVPGRLERVPGSTVSSPLVVVDYAHTPEAVSGAIASLRPLIDGRLTTVLGCGGDRDKGKRPQMGRAAALGSDLVVATSDNPRTEDPSAIIAAMVEGARAASGASVLSVVPRRRAIAAAIAQAKEGDAVLVAGKGHEPYQEVGGKRYPMDDVAEARASLSHPSGRRVVEVLTCDEVAAAMNAEVVGTPPDAWISCNAGVVSDSRKVVDGSIFVALRGERFDGHDFLSQVAASGAAGLIVEAGEGAQKAAEAWATSGRTGVTWVVADTLRAMGDLATATLEAMRSVSPGFVTVGITGSNGKTTTKELVSALLETFCGLAPSQIHKNPGNHNNLIGVPQTIFELRFGVAVLVLEMGTNAFGEIARLVEIGAPEVRVLTTVSGAHLEGFETWDGVLRAKAELLDGMVAGQTAVLPADLWEREALSGKLPPGAGLALFERPVEAPVSGADAGSVRAVPRSVASVVSRKTSSDFEEIVVEVRSVDTPAPTGRLATASVEEPWRRSVRSPLRGAHNATNLAAAVLAARLVFDRLDATGTPSNDAGLDLRGVLEVPGGRLRVCEGVGEFGNARIVDDCYNANPGSMEAGLEVVREMAQEQGAAAVAVLGDMFELGAKARELHREVGRRAATMGLDVLVTFGDLAEAIIEGLREAGSETTMIHVSGREDAAAQAVVDAVRAHLGASRAVVLVKGSRGMRMERIVVGMTGGRG